MADPVHSTGRQCHPQVITKIGPAPSHQLSISSIEEKDFCEKAAFQRSNGAYVCTASQEIAFSG